MSSPKKLDFSLVLACYKEESHLEKSMKQLIDALNTTNYSWEIIMIDDKSPDSTAQIVKKISQSNSNITAIYHDVNQGRGGTVTEGILKARSDIVGFIDVDLEVGPDYIPEFVRVIKQKEAEVVIARRYEPFLIFPLNLLMRIIASRGYVYLMQRLLKLPFEDTEAGYKFFNKKKILPILSQTEDKHWFWDTEIVARSFYDKLKIKSVPVLFLKKEDKKSTVRIIPDTIAYLRAISKFKRSLKNEV